MKKIAITVKTKKRINVSKKKLQDIFVNQKKGFETPLQIIQVC